MKFGVAFLLALLVMTAEAKASGVWQEKMQDLYKTLAEVLTDSSSEKRFNQPAAVKRIEKNASRLFKIAHDLTGKDMVPPDGDPTLRMVAKRFQLESNRVVLALSSGRREYARSLLNGISSHCIACHTRDGSGPRFGSLPNQPPAADLTAMEQGNFFAATRQYDRAHDAYTQYIGDEATTFHHPLDWEQAVRQDLAILVRVKADPVAALALVEKALAQKGVPYFIRQQALQWRESLRKWKEEPARKALTEEGLHAEAMLLITQARETQKYPADHSGDVYYLRASATLHELLKMAPKGRFAAEALFLEGLCYELLQSQSIGDLHEMYYEACVRQEPHSPVAENCFKRYESSTYQGFTGSSGTHLPGDVRHHLAELEGLASPSKEKIQ